jgi:methionine biosynthesis protein MetW
MKPTLISPDNNSVGFLDRVPTSMRYEQASREKDDTAMKLAGRIPAGSRVLDVGCGSGPVTEILQTVSNAIIIGVEPDEERAERARGRGLTVINDYLSEAIIRDHGPFDFIVFADVLEHLPNPAQIVCLAKEALKPGGCVLVSVPNGAHFYARLDLLRGIIRYEDSGIMDATHLRWFTWDSIKSFFERLDFDVTYQDYTVFAKMHMYANRKPFSWMKPRLRAFALRGLAAWQPRLFAVQHIVEARKRRP